MTFELLAYSQSEELVSSDPDVMLGPFLETFVSLGLRCCYAFWHFSPKNFRLFLGQPKGPLG